MRLKSKTNASFPNPVVNILCNYVEPMVKLGPWLPTRQYEADESMGQFCGQFSRYARRQLLPVANAAFSIIFP